ncbi:acyltransferase [Sphingomonas aliaeris]|uniref:Acyltransferase n=2 Tax=Sphingomonas aliaeris TaxID=2759526 RepID=A0A974NUH9_9SPHN|nr:acyltransferase [Sphingomonas aliaeris]
MIVLLHFRTLGTIGGLPFVQNAFLFVDFFFVLSGFVIAASYGEKLQAGFSIVRFMGLRLGRIYPLHIFVLGIFLLFEIATMGVARNTSHQPFAGNYSLELLLANMALVQTFVGPEGASWNMPAWSIAVEVWTYLVFAISFRYLGRFIVPTAIALVLGCSLYLVFATDRYLNVFHDGAFARCLIGFSIGVITYHAHRRLQLEPPRPFASAIEIAVVVAVTGMVSVAGMGALSLLLPPLFGVAIFVFATQSGIISKLLLAPVPRYLGKISYSIYLVHLFIVYRFFNMLEVVQRKLGITGLVTSVNGEDLAGPTPLWGDLLSITMLVTVIAVASFTYSYVERPANEWSRRKLLGRREKGVPTGLLGAEMPATEGRPRI